MCSSKSVGFDWWHLLKREEWSGLLDLVHVRTETAAQQNPNTHDYLLHALCKHAKTPPEIFTAVLQAFPPATLLEDSSGRLPLHRVVSRQGSPTDTTQFIIQLIAAEPRACNVGVNYALSLDGKHGFLPLHELLAHATTGVDIEKVGNLMLDAYPQAIREHRLHEGVASNSKNQYPLQVGMDNRRAPSTFLLKLLTLNPEVVLKKPDQNYNFHFGGSPETESVTFLNWACQLNYSAEFILALLAANPTAAHTKDSAGNLALHICCKHGDRASTAVIQELIQEYKGALLVPDHEKNLPLHCVCENMNKNLSFIAGIMIDLEPKAVSVRDKQGNLPIHSLCEASGAVANDTILLFIDIFPNGLAQVDRQKNLPLHSAIERGDAIPLHVLQKMVQKYPEAATKKDREGNTPLHSACECRSQNLDKIVQLLLKADPHNIAIQAKDKGGNLPLHCACENIKPCGNTILLLMRAYPEALQKRDKSRNLPIHSAIENVGNVPVGVIEEMLNLFPDAVKKHDWDGQLPLHCVFHRPNQSTERLVAIASLLLEIDPSAACAKSRRLGLLLHHSCRSLNSLLLIQKLTLDPKAATMKNSQGDLPLHVICERGDSGLLSIVQYLMRHYPDGIPKKDRDGNTCLHSACETLHTNVSAVAMEMIELRPKAAEIRDRSGNLAIHSICESRTPVTDVILKLISVYPDGLKVKDKGNNLPLHSVLERGDAVEFLAIKKMIDSYPEAVTKKDRGGNTPLHCACECRTKELPAIVKLLLDADVAGIACKTRDRDGNLPIHSACEQKIPSAEVVLMFVNANPEGLKLRDRGKNLPLHSALERGDAGVPRRVIQKMVDVYPEAVTKKDAGGNTPLHCACECRTKELPAIVKLLLDADVAGIACKTRDREGNLPIHSACEQKIPSAEVVLMLIDANPDGLKQKDKGGNLPIHSAVERGDITETSVIEKMLTVYPGSMLIKDRDRNTPLHSACETLNTKLIEVLTLMLNSPSGKSAAAIKDYQYNLAIHSCCESKKIDGKIQEFAINILIEAYPGGLNVKDSDKNLPLHSALERGDGIGIGVLQKMVQCNPQACSVQDAGGNTRTFVFFVCCWSSFGNVSLFEVGLGRVFTVFCFCVLLFFLQHSIAL